MGTDHTLMALHEIAEQSDLHESFDSFVLAEYPALVATARILVGSPEVAEELVQEALLRTYQRWNRVRKLDRPGAWARRVTINSSLSHLRRRRIERRVAARQARDPQIVDDAHEPDGFAALIRGLPRKEAAAIALRYGADLPVPEVAAHLRISEAAARSLLQRARDRLRQEIPTKNLGG